MLIFESIGAIFPNINEGNLGWTIGPPSDLLYAVDPNGVAMHTPFPLNDSNLSP